MTTQYTAWLQSLGRRRADMPMAVRKMPVSHTVTYPGDVTAATLAGKIKSAPDSPTALAVWTVGTPAFAGGVTTWTVSLTGTQTNALPADGDLDGVSYFVYDFILTQSGNPDRIFGGLFPLSGYITEPA